MLESIMFMAALRIVYRNNNVRFDQLFQINKSYNIHHKNIQTLAIELL